MSDVQASAESVVGVASADAGTVAARVKITEIFCSIQGESTLAGWPTVFVRLTGCPLRCTYCDTEYAFYGGAWQSTESVLAAVAGHGVRHVCVTGGEPLAQKGVFGLMAQLCDAGYTVSVETSGAMDIQAVDARVVKILDLKTPDSGEMQRNLMANLEYLQPHDEIKFVVCSRADFDWAAGVVHSHTLSDRHTVLISPSYGQVDPAELSQWLIDSGLKARLNLQLHKTIWGEEQGR